MALTGAQPALLRHDDRDRRVQHLGIQHSAGGRLDQGAAVVAILLGVSLDFLDQEALERVRVPVPARS
ncbi:hypothetical protein G6F50_017880 [Rhizopus delemar]|uniref:Uncharacterized protein n=1 Tax=Rhizopus delemar TaxID=936053 RepID=A0A9P6XPU8_9FUNG|nr:hypothetical protein G6F50_017880 [Rhizopus delemar]